MLTQWLPLLGVAVVVIGFALRFNPVPVVVAAGVVSGFVPACASMRATGLPRCAA